MILKSMKNTQLTIIDLIEEMCTRKGLSLNPLHFARDIMNSNVKTLTLDHNVNQCLKFMESRNVRHVPVVDLPYEGEKKPCFIGIVSQRDVLRLSAHDTRGNIKQEIDRRALRQLLVQIVSRRPKSVSLQTPTQKVISTMTSNHIDMVPVLDSSNLVGIITTTDILKLLFRLDKATKELLLKLRKDKAADARSEDSAKAEMLSSWSIRAVEEIMTREVICLEPRNNIDRAIEILQTEEIRHLIITNEQGKFLGLISDRDILHNLPFAGRRPPSPPKKFREHLFAIKSLARKDQIPLEKIMVDKSKVLSIEPGCGIVDAARTLYEKKISCLPVLDEREKVRGIVTITDLMRALLNVYEPIEKVSQAK